MQIKYTVVATPKKGRDTAKEISEDAYACAPEDMQPFIAVVVDAHGQSNRVAADLAQFIANRLVELYVSIDTVVSFSQLFLIVQKEVVEHFATFLNGAVATCLIIDRDKVTIAQVGNCRVYSLDATSAECVALTQDHSVSNPVETKRLQPFFENGTFVPVVYNNAWRLSFNQKKEKPSAISLVSTRGFGNPDFHPAFTYVPEVRTFALDPTASYLFALCTDGGVQTVLRTALWAKTICITSLEGIAGIANRKIPEDPEDDLLILLIEISPTL